MKIVYTIGDRVVTFEGHDAAMAIETLAKFTPITTDIVGHYLPELGITIEEIHLGE